MLEPQDASAGGCWRDIRAKTSACVFDRDPAARSRIEVLLTYPGLHAHPAAPPGSRVSGSRGWRFSRTLAGLRLARLLTNVDIHPGASIGRRCLHRSRRRRGDRRNRRNR
jgi:serine O-acetyltransferase